MVGIDETTLSLILHPKARPPQDPATKKPVDRVEDRIEKLLEDLDADNERIVLPTPGFANSWYWLERMVQRISTKSEP